MDFSDVSFKDGRWMEEAEDYVQCRQLCLWC
jgi:hypothetical protein